MGNHFQSAAMEPSPLAMLSGRDLTMGIGNQIAVPMRLKKRCDLRRADLQTRDASVPSKHSNTQRSVLSFTARIRMLKAHFFDKDVSSLRRQVA